MREYVDLTGKVFNRLTVIKRDRNNKYGRRMWLCQCSCGNIKPVIGQLLKEGRVKSCGCLLRENVSIANSTHKLSRSPLYKIFYSMKQRCLNPNDKSYKYYGGKGVTIYQNWIDNFLEFNTWAIENGYSKGLSIDRINNDGDYEPKNCRWVTHLEQVNNQKSNIHVEYDGETMTLSQAARNSGISYWTLYSRVRNNCSQKKLFNTPIHGKK